MHAALLEVAIDDVDSELESLGKQLEFKVHFGEPVDQDAAHFLIYVVLGLHLVLVGVLVGLGVEAVAVHVLSLQGAVESVCFFFEVYALQFCLEVDAFDHGTGPSLHESSFEVLLLLEVTL